jgi:hypothetical protein
MVDTPTERGISMSSNAVSRSTNTGPFLTPQAPKPANLPRPGRLPDQITVEHGPAALLGRFFLKADGLAQTRGVSLSLASLDELMDTNRRNRATWKPLVPLFDPAVGGITPENGLAILGRNAAGEVVAAQGARFYDWSGSDLEAEFTSQRMHYADPAASARPDETCRIFAPSARRITGKVVFSGAGWYRPDYRGQLLSMILPRISRALAYTRWKSDYTISMMADGVVAGGMAKRCGYTEVEDGVELLNSPMAPKAHGFLVWMPAEQLLADLAWFLSDFTAEVDAAVEYRRA